MNQHRSLRILAIAAIAFGALTVLSGGRALFGGDEARASLGNIVDFVLWFNFLAGFVYVLTGVGLWLNRAWSPWTASALAIATGFVAGAFAFRVLGGGAYEMRTVGALVSRLGFWMVVATVAVRSFRRVR